MSNEQARQSFLNQIKADPENEDLRLIFADWLDEYGDRAESDRYRTLSVRTQMMLEAGRVDPKYPRDRETIEAILRSIKSPLFEPVISFQINFGGISYFGGNSLKLGIFDGAGEEKPTDYGPWTDGRWYYPCAPLKDSTSLWMDQDGVMYLVSGVGEPNGSLAPSIQNMIEHDALSEELRRNEDLFVGQWQGWPGALELPLPHELEENLQSTNVRRVSSASYSGNTWFKGADDTWVKARSFRVEDGGGEEVVINISAYLPEAPENHVVTQVLRDMGCSLTITPPKRTIFQRIVNFFK